MNIVWTYIIAILIGAALCQPCLGQQVPAENQIITFKERTRLDKLPEIIFCIRYPKGKKPGDVISGVVCDVSYQNVPKNIIDRLSRSASKVPLYAFAEKHDMVVISWTTATLYSTATSFRLSEKKAMSKDNQMSIAAKEWNRGIDSIVEKYNFPEGNYLIYGISRGAQWAHRIALRYPERFLAVHAHVNSSYETPVKEARSCLWLITTGELEWGYPAAKKFYTQAREMGYPILFKAQQNLGHSSSRKIDRLGVHFFEYAWKLKADYQVYKEKNLAGPVAERRKFPKYGFVDEYLTDYTHPPYYGDYINANVVTADRKELIPEKLRVGIPSKDLAEAYGTWLP